MQPIVKEVTNLTTNKLFIWQIMQDLEINKIISNISWQYHKYLQPENIIIFKETTSTNSYLLECAKQKTNKLIFCLAGKQTSGRGRFNRTWISPAGNIYLSILWSFNHTISKLSGISLAIALAINRALIKYGITFIKVKWPNDILYNNSKLAGVLIETISKINNTAVVIGLGINIDISSIACKNNDLNTNLPPIDLTSITNKITDRNLLIGLLINSILDIIFLFETNGFEPFIKEWHTYDYSYGKSVTIISGEKIISGINRGVDKMGNLLLEVLLDNGSITLQSIASGEVSKF